MSTPVVRIKFSDALPPGASVVPVEGDGALTWYIRRDAMSEGAVAEAEAILQHLAERGDWRQQWTRPGVTPHDSDDGSRGASPPLVLYMQPSTEDLPGGRSLVLLEADGELVWRYRPGAMSPEFGEQAGMALGYLVRQGAWVQHWNSEGGLAQDT